MHDFAATHPEIERPPENHIQLMIGKVASLSGITVQTLRHYDKIGLFRPEVTNPETGYRYYSLEQLRHLEYILFLRRLQFSLPEIQAAMDEFGSGKDLMDVLSQKDRQLQAEIDGLQSLRDTIQSLFHLRDTRQIPLNQLRIDLFSPPRQLLVHAISPLSVSDPDFPLRLMEHRKKLLGSIPPIQTSFSFGAVISRSDFQDSGVLRYSGVLLDPGPYGIALSSPSRSPRAIMPQSASTEVKPARKRPINSSVSSSPGTALRLTTPYWKWPRSPASPPFRGSATL